MKPEQDQKHEQEKPEQDGSRPRRVVVTGIGAVTSLGLDVATLWRACLAGCSAVSEIEAFDATGYPTRIAAEIKGWDPSPWMDRKDARRMDRFVQFAVAAARMALVDSGLVIAPENQDRVGVTIGSGIGGLSTLEQQHKILLERGPGRVSPLLIPGMIADMAAGMVSILLGARGPNSCVVSACATGAQNIGEAYHIIQRGDADVMIAGGTEAAITPLGMAGFCAARAMTTCNAEPERASRPFDASRDGFVMAEGSGILILEALDTALARGARIYAEVAGYGAAGDAYHITAPAPDGGGATRAMLMALRQAGLEPEDVDYINAHGTSTPLNDRIETAAIKAALGDHAYRVAVSSTKSMLGHLNGGAGAVEAILCALMIRHGVILPTINYEQPDPDCDLDYVPNCARRAEVRVALSNSFGFGGHNASLLLTHLAQPDTS
jgi:3-oxoacyl-[acyl-carrier-protein] synthase II